MADEDLDMVACDCEPSSNDLTSTEPSIAFQAEQGCYSSIFDLQFWSVLPQLLDTIQFLPKWLVPPRNAVKKKKKKNTSNERSHEKNVQWNNQTFQKDDLKGHMRKMYNATARHLKKMIWNNCAGNWSSIYFLSCLVESYATTICVWLLLVCMWFLQTPQAFSFSQPKPLQIGRFNNDRIIILQLVWCNKRRRCHH